MRALLLAVCLISASPVDDCQGVMAALVAAQQQVSISIDSVDALTAAIEAPSWDPVGEAWMLDALDVAMDDLIGDLNAASIAEAQAHAAHCY